MATAEQSQDSGSSILDYDEMMAELRPRMREWKASWDLIRSNPTAMAGVIMIIFIVILAILAPFLAPASGADPMYIPRDFELPKPPFIEGHPLGTGEMGADIFYGCVWGTRTTITTSLFVVLTSALIGLILGAFSGYYGGVIDEVIMRFTDIFLSLPALILAMAIAAILTRSLENMMFALIIVWWPAYARLVRGQVLSIRENTYVEAARAIGASKNRILFRHVVPNALSPLIVSITLDLGAVALTAAGLSYIGFGVPSGYAEWGRMVSDGQSWFLQTVPYNGQMYTPWWVVTFPGLMILTFTMGFSLIGDGLRDILDPRSRR
ncbi:MAG: ABC transporter permease [Candidatus Saccharibacteria bacterium]